MPSAHRPGVNLTNSFSRDHERSYTVTFSLFFGLKLWPGAGLYAKPAVIAERTLSQLRGLGGATENFELRKMGSATSSLYRARTFLRQSFNLGGEPVALESNPLQLGGTVESRRLLLTVGNFSALDIFDRNSVTGDPRQTFFNEAFMTHASYDFAADARGFTYGAVGELI